MQKQTQRSGLSPQRRCFTLIELIMVLSVISIIVGMSFGVMASLSTRKGVEGGARIISRQLFLCRDYAIMRRQRIALLIPLGDDGTGLSDVNQAFEDKHGNVAGYDADTSAYFAHATRPCIVDRNQEFVSWVQNTKWQFLPERVRLEASGLPEIKGKFGLGSTYRISGIIFKPNGSLTVVDDIGNDDPVGDILQVTNGAGQDYRLRVNWLTGKASFVE